MFLFNVPTPTVSEDKTQVLSMPSKYSTTDYIPAPIPLLFKKKIYIELYLYSLLTLKIPGQGVQRYQKDTNLHYENYKSGHEPSKRLVLWHVLIHMGAFCEEPWHV